MISLTPSHLINHLYCPRYTYFEWVLQIPRHEDNYSKVLRGRQVHDDRLEQNKGYLRRRLGVVSRHDDQYLTNDHLRGRVDEVLELNDDTLAPLDYKFAEYKNKVYITYKTQLQCYAWLIEDNFGRRVTRGYLVYTRSNNRVITVPITTADIDHVKLVADDIRRVIQQNYFPRATPVKKRCVSCTYRKICVQ